MSKRCSKRKASNSEMMSVDQVIVAREVFSDELPMVQGVPVENTKRMRLDATRASPRLVAQRLKKEKEENELKMVTTKANLLANLWSEDLGKIENLNIYQQLLSEEIVTTPIENVTIIKNIGMPFMLYGVQSINGNSELKNEYLKNGAKALQLAQFIVDNRLKLKDMSTISGIVTLKKDDADIKNMPLSKPSKFLVYVPISLREEPSTVPTVDSLGLVKKEEQLWMEILNNNKTFYETLKNLSMDPEYQGILEWITENECVVDPKLLDKAFNNGEFVDMNFSPENVPTFKQALRIINARYELDKELTKMANMMEGLVCEDVPEGLVGLNGSKGGSSWAYITKKASSFLSSVKKSIGSKAREATKPTTKKPVAKAASSTKKQDKQKPKKQEEAKAKKAKAPEPKKKVAEKPKKAVAATTKKSRSSKKL
jgi:hypothetical protein